MSLNDVASLHNLVTVVDAASIFEQLSTMDTLVDRGWHELEGDKRTVAHLLVDQLESNLNPKPNPLSLSLSLTLSLSLSLSVSLPYP